MILPCPICGKQPKMTKEITYEVTGETVWCCIKCKPFLKKPHLKVDARGLMENWVEAAAIGDWNRAVELYKQKEENNNG